MRKPAIPAVPASAADQGRAAFDHAVKESLELVIGRRSGRIKPLASSATLADVIAKVNEILEQLQ